MQGLDDKSGSRKPTRYFATKQELTALQGEVGTIADAVDTVTAAVAAVADEVDEVGADLSALTASLGSAAFITAGLAGASMLVMALVSDVRNFLDTAAYHATRTTLKAVDIAKETTFILKEDGREGIFNWKTGDFSTQIAADPAEGVYIKVDAVAATVGALVRVFDGVADLRWFGAVANGTANDKGAVDAGIASGWPLTGSRKTYAVSGKISLIGGTRLWDATLKQLAPGASLNVITLEADGVSDLDIRRVKVDRNGDGTNGGLLNASGVNGALSTARGMSFIGCARSHFEDLEVYGNDSGSGILFRQIGETSKIIRPYAHDIGWSRTAATDDQVQGLWFDQCTRCPIIRPRAINLTGVLNGVVTRRFTRSIAAGGNVGITISDPYMEHADQGLDITGGPTPNRDILIEGGIAKDIWVWGFKLANTARRVTVRDCRTYDCGVGFVASPQLLYTPDVTTDRCKFVNCIAYNSGSNGQTVVAVAGFRVLETAANLQGRAANIEFVRCLAIDEQAVKTMTHGFTSEITDINVAPWLIDCESVGHITAATAGLFRTGPGVVGTVSQTGGKMTGAVLEAVFDANGGYIRHADGYQECWTSIDDSAVAWATAHGAAFVRATPLTWAYQKTFAVTPHVEATAERGADGLALGVSVRAIGASSADLTPYCFVSLAGGNSKKVHIKATGRWF